MGVKRVAAIVAAVLGLLAVSSVASAHPLGNFTINHYAGVEVAGSDI